MDIMHLELSDMYRALARHCNDFEDQQEGSCFAEDSNLGCPFRIDENGDFLGCGGIDPEHWREVFEGKNKPDAQFRFGDKVTHYVDIPVRAVFSAYKDSIYTGEAYVLFDGEPECQVVPLRNLKAGWE